jgi:hypothetical protein
MSTLAATCRPRPLEDPWWWKWSFLGSGRGQMLGPAGRSPDPLQRCSSGSPASNWFSTGTRLCSADFKTILSFMTGHNR